MINDAFKDIDKSIDVALFADDGAMWKRGRNIVHIANKMQQAADTVRKWALEWGFRISVEKTSYVIHKESNTSGLKNKDWGQRVGESEPI